MEDWFHLLNGGHNWRCVLTDYPEMGRVHRRWETHERVGLWISFVYGLSLVETSSLNKRLNGSMDNSMSFYIDLKYKMSYVYLHIFYIYINPILSYIYMYLVTITKLSKITNDLFLNNLNISTECIYTNFM